MQKLTLKQANDIIEHALAKSHELKTKPLGVVVIDDGGNIISAQRDDGASMFRIDVGRGKAWAAVAIGMSSRAVGAKAKGNPNFFVSLASTGGGKFVPQTGAVLIRDAQGNILGAAGSSGGSADEDEPCCIHGVTKTGFRADDPE